MNRFDSMMIGAIGAILFKKGNYIFTIIVDNKLTQAIALSILGLLIINKFPPIPLIDNFVVALMTLTIIVGQINRKNRLVSFENKVLDFLRKISFGIYVYHPLLIFLLAKVIGKVPGESIGKYILVYASVLLATIALAHFSYTYFESWFIRLKRKFAVVKSTAVREQPDTVVISRPQPEHVE